MDFIRALAVFWGGRRSWEWFTLRGDGTPVPDALAGRWNLLALACLRGLYVLSILLYLVDEALQGVLRPLGLFFGLLVAATACTWSCGLVGHWARRGSLAAGVVCADVLAQGLVLPSFAALVGMQELPLKLWATGSSLMAAVLVGATLEPRTAVAAAAVLSLEYVIVLGRHVGYVPALAQLPDIVMASLLAALGTRCLRQYAHSLYAEHRCAIDSAARKAAESARTGERTRQLRLLHDTALNTLTAIARGSLDYRSESVRERCAREAEYLRAVILVGECEPGSLADELRETVAWAAQLGLRVHMHCDTLRTACDSAVVKALCQAAGEALNNVARHSGSNQAWVSVFDESGVLSVRVVDQGSGFSAWPGDFGFGLRASVLERMHEIGGIASVTSAPGRGTCVELLWPA